MEMCLLSCPVCDAVPEGGVCACGVHKPATYVVTLTDAGCAYDSFRSQRRRGQPGEVAPYFAVYDDVRWNHDHQRLERRLMRVDREADGYIQEWYDLETGEPTYRKEGRLSDPKLHGQSARRRKHQ
jgi:hypothetical protein